MPRCSRLALLLLAVGAVQLAAALGWWAWRWPEATGQAFVGAVAIALFPQIVLALEFLLLARVGQAQGNLVAPTAGQLLRAWADESWQLLRVFYGRMPLRWREPPDALEPARAGRRGVVFIHGYVCNRGFWAPWLREVQQRGHAYIAINLEPVFSSIDDYVPLVEDAVSRVTACTGTAPLLVCHSMGGLVARAWLRSAQGAPRVHRVVTIGSPHRGTWLARFSSMPNGRQVRLHSEWLQQLERDEQVRARPAFTCWYSNCDNIVFPVATATLPGADNRFVPGLAHVALAFHPQVMAHTLAALTSSVQARPEESVTSAGDEK